jgi:hypothetical protein
MAERERLATVGGELLDLIRTYKADRLVDRSEISEGRVAINKKILELSKHLGNIAGFCDSGGKRAIHVFSTSVLGTSMLDPLYYSYLRALLPTIIGIQVDFTKKPPFKLVGDGCKGLGCPDKGHSAKAVSKRSGRGKVTRTRHHTRLRPL